MGKEMRQETSPLARKRRSESLLGSLGVGINTALPPTEMGAEVQLRDATEIATRAICLTAVVSRALGDSKKFLLEYLAQKSCLEHLTGTERALLSKPKLNAEDCIRFTWQVEALRVLLWSIGYAQVSVPGFERCDSHKDVFPHCSSAGNDGSVFIAEASLLETDVLMDMADLCYRAHWAVRQNRLDDRTPTGPLVPGVVLEYHRAINWVIGYERQEWDDVSTDT